MKIDYKFLQNDLETIKRHDDRIIEMSNIDIQIENVEKYFENGVNKIIDFLNKEGFINTKKGEIASVIKEVNCLAFSKLIDGKILTKLQPEQIVGLLSCFTEIRVGDDIRKIKPDSHNEEINEILNNISNDYNYYDDGIKYNIHYDIIDETLLWCNSKTYEECFEIIKILESKKIFLGEFSRALLKINNITNELIKVTKISNDVELENKLTQVRDLTLKFVICNQSLYL
jgi:superfamily II RNA helicase